MENKLILGFVFMLLLVVTVNALDLKDMSPKQIDKNQVLDENYLIKSEGVYFKGLKQDNPIVWIDKLVGTTYHVDSLKTFIENESVSVEFYYEIQPDWIAHYAHSGKFDRYYYPTQWNWVSDCSGIGKEQVCSGGWVILIVQNIEEGIGSSSFPVGVTGPTRARNGQFYGEFDGVASFVDVDEQSEVIFNGTGLENGFTISAWIKPKSKGEISGRVIDKSSGDGGTDGFVVNLNENRLQIKINAGFGANAASGSTTYNIWQHILVTVSSSQLANWYLDGSLSGTANQNLVQGISAITTTNDPRIGNQATLTTRTFDGSIDEILFFNRTLGQTEITNLYNNYTLISSGPRLTGVIPNSTGLILDMDFNDYSVADDSGLGNHGINTNVSFGEVFSNTRKLIRNTDYTLIGNVFTLINADYSWTQLVTNFREVISKVIFRS